LALAAGTTCQFNALAIGPPVVSRHYLVSRKLVDGPQPLRVAHVSLPPGPEALRALRTAVCDLIVYTGPNPPVGDARARLVALAALGPAFALREAPDQPPIAQTGLRVLDDPIQLTLRGQAVDLALAERGAAELPALLRALAVRPSYRIVAARTADLAPRVAADPRHGVDLFLAATAGRSGLRQGLAPRGALRLHIAASTTTAIFTLDGTYGAR
jgi:hypothetical protein